MLFFRETLIAVFAAIGMGTVLFLAFRRMLFSPETLQDPVCFTVAVTHETENLEETVRELQELCRTYGKNARIVLLDAGMTPETRQCVRILLREDESITLSAAEDLLQSILGN